MPYLNQAGTSWPKPSPVRAAVAEALASDPVGWPARLERARDRVARELGVGDPARLLFTPGCTSALAVAAADVPWAAGDRAVLSSMEHHALHRPVSKLAGRGVESLTIPRAEDGPIDLELLERELARGGVRLVAVSAASNVTGELLPIARIVELAHAHGALCLVDAAQSAGWLPHDVDALGADLFAFAGHKALHGPWGIGGLVVAAQLAMDTPAAACALPAGGAAPSCAPMPGYCDVGSVDHVGLAGLVAALDWLALPAQAERLPRARARAAALAEGLAQLQGVRLHGRLDFETRLPFVTFTVEGRASAEVAAALAERELIVSGGLQCAPLAHAALGTPEGVLRASFGPTNKGDDVATALETLRAVLA